MIVRLSQALAKKLKIGKLPARSPDESPYADWSAHLFTADRTQYIILTNTRSLYSVVMYGKGITDDSRFLGRALDNIREFMDADGQAFVYRRFVAPASGTVYFAKALNRSVTASMNDRIRFAKFWLAEGELAPFDVGFKLNEIPLSTLGQPGGYLRPREAFKLLSPEPESADGGDAMSDTEKPAAGLLRAAPRETEEGVLPGPSIGVLLTCAQRRAIAELLPQVADRLKLDEQAARKIAFLVAELETVRDKTQDALLQVESGTKRKSLQKIVDRVTAAREKAEGRGVIPASERLYQFKITLLASEPPIWRRIQVRDCTLDNLHEHIQTAMGWTNSHLHQFEINGRRCGDPGLLADETYEFDGVDSTVTRISRIVPRDGKRFRFRYEYDFGDCWEHEVLFEGCLRADQGERYPLCVEGERACPPEDVGGIWGYARFLEALGDPHHEHHQQFVEWIGGSFDSELFDAKEATETMWQGLPDWREYF